MSRLFVFTLLFLFVGMSKAFLATGSDLHMNKESAYCYYYLSSNPYISNEDTYMNATSNNLYAYASVYASVALEINSDSIALGKCSPNSGPNNSCSTSAENTFTYVSYSTEYILVCLECHYWLGDCIIDQYEAHLNSSPQEGYIPCSICH